MSNLLCKSLSRSGPKLTVRLPFFLHHTVDPLSGPGWLEALVIGQAGCPAKIPRRPAIDQARFPNERTTHGDIVCVGLLHELLGQLEGADPPDQDQGSP